MKIGYVCTNYNNSAYTREAVCSLGRNGGHEFRIVVVDNHSDKENVEALKNLANEFEHVELILNQENVGYFRGLNLGIRHLRASQPGISIMVVGNNDLVFPDDFAEAISRNLSTLERHAVVSPDIVTLDGVHQNPHVVSEIGKFREFIYDLYYANYYLAIAIRKVARLSRGVTDRADETHHDLVGRNGTPGEQLPHQRGIDRRLGRRASRARRTARRRGRRPLIPDLPRHLTEILNVSCEPHGMNRRQRVRLRPIGLS